MSAAAGSDAVAYAGNPEKRGLDLLLGAWALAAPDGGSLTVGGISTPAAQRWLQRRGARLPPGVRFTGALEHGRWLATVAAARVYVSAARNEDWGIAQTLARAITAGFQLDPRARAA